MMKSPPPQTLPFRSNWDMDPQPLHRALEVFTFPRDMLFLLDGSIAHLVAAHNGGGGRARLLVGPTLYSAAASRLAAFFASTGGWRMADGGFRAARAPNGLKAQ
jgi:hypothetical protein